MYRMTRKWTFLPVLCLALLLNVAAQTKLEAPAPQRSWDVAISYQATRSNTTTARGFWLQGGDVQTNYRVWRQLRAVADFSGSHNGSMDGTGVALNLFTASFGPGYQWSPAKSRYTLRAEALFGVAHGFNSVFPEATVASHSANSFAFSMGGGVDYALNSRFSVRLLDVRWLRTQFPDNTTGVQNHAQFGAGLVFRLR